MNATLNSRLRNLRLDVPHPLRNQMQQAVARICNQAVAVTAGNDQVYLSGVVSSWHEKQMAQEAIRSVESNTRIINLVAVRNAEAN